MNKIRSIIIDDEAASRDVLENLLRKHCPSVEVVAGAVSAKEGYELIRAAKPDLVFLGICLPVTSGFDLLRLFDEIPFSVIFVTDYDEYAIQAFEFNAMNYILKPVDYTKLIKSVNRVEQSIRLQQGSDEYVRFIRSIDEKTQLLKRISLHRKDKVLIIDIDNISYIQAIRNYCEVVTFDNQRILSTKTLSDYEQLLEPYEQFLRVNKGYVVNINFIKSYSKGSVCFIAMKNDDLEMEVSRRKKSEILHYLKHSPQFAGN